jgi:hypothetical protein
LCGTKLMKNTKNNPFFSVSMIECESEGSIHFTVTQKKLFFYKPKFNERTKIDVVKHRATLLLLNIHLNFILFIYLFTIIERERVR